MFAKELPSKQKLYMFSKLYIKLHKLMDELIPSGFVVFNVVKMYQFSILLYIMLKFMKWWRVLDFMCVVANHF